jgi:hypothetical protein
MLIHNNGSQASGGGVIGAIRDAASATGAKFQYLLATAKVESGLNPQAAASSSSARGLFQFIDQTWLTTLKEAGTSLGFGRYADAIARQPSGRYEITDASKAREIMALRNDPAANAAMAGAFTRQNAEMLTERLGRAPTDGELYIAHFLGPAGAGRLITLAANSPGASAANEFPGAARANRSIFYDRQGRARTAAEVYGTLVGRYQMAAAQPKVPTAPAVAALPQIPSTGVTAVSRTANLAVVNAVASPQPSLTATTALTPPGGTQAPAGVSPIAPGRGFRSLFSDTDARGPVSPIVQELWSTRPMVAAALSGQSAPGRGGAQANAPLDLFADRPADARGLFGVRS